jgi:hypothetical protein
MVSALNCRAPRAEREGGDKAGEEEECVCTEEETWEGGMAITETKRALGSDVTH